MYSQYFIPDVTEVIKIEKKYIISVNMKE